MKKGTIYTQGDSLRGSTRIYQSIKRLVTLFTLRSASLALILASTLFLCLLFAPVILAEIKFNFSDTRYSESDLVAKSEAANVQSIQNLAGSYGVKSHYSLVVPKIGAASDIVANVDVSDEDQYLNALTQGVAHASGTYFPGQGKQIFLFSHSTDAQINISRYNAIFYLLRKLEKGDNVIVFYADKKYVYKVDNKVVVDPSDVEWLADRQEETLILQTCYPPGTTLKRLIIEAKPA